ncbi:MAG: endonuclease MutS2 [bacterium]|nr:endonuclease MutS2 [bacterium]
MQASFELLELDKLLETCAGEASSELGRRRILELEPLADITAIRRELALVDEMARLLGRKSLPIQGLSDVSATLKKLSPAGSVLDRHEYPPLRDLVAASGKLAAFFAEQKEDYPGLVSLAKQLGDFGELTALVDKIFDPAGDVRDDASPELKRIRRQKESEARNLHKILEQVLREWKRLNYAQDEALAYRDGKLLIPVKAEHRGRVSGAIQDESASGATVFVEPLEAIAVSNVMRRLDNEERREIFRILLELCDKFRSRLPEIYASLAILSELDSIYARARLAIRLDCVPPEMTEAPFIKLVNARHPLLGLKLGKSVVPLNLTLGGADGEVLIITGPNAGGKTVTLKTVGMLCLMAACGLLVPAGEGTQIPVLAALHCDIGDPQSLEQDLSTFTSHLIRLKAALQDPRQPKLVLLDEVGSGTDPAEGTAIARAALLELQAQGALTVATTHQGILKAFAHEAEGIFNGSMEFDGETLQPTFRFHSGIPGSSYALQIGARVGFPAEVLRVAQRFLGEQTSRLEDLLTRLNESLRISEETRRQAEIKRTEQEALRKLYADRIREIKDTEKQRLHEAAVKAKELLADANRSIEAAVKSIRETQASKEAIKQAHTVIKYQKQKVEQILSAPKEEETPPPEPGLQAGDRVKVEDLKGTVRVMALRRDGQEAKLEMGGIHIWMDVDRLTKVDIPAEDKIKASVNLNLAESDSTRPGYEIDLRGMTGDEAEFTVEKYLSEASLAGWKSVRIIHGKGTGALRTRVRELLERSLGIKSFRYGRPEEGDFGVTIVELE